MTLAQLRCVLCAVFSLSLSRVLLLVHAQPMIFGIGVIFYLSIPANGTGRRRNPNSSALEVYEMTDIVDRMGFSSD